MVAASIAMPARLPLLLPPDKPAAGMTGTFGWRWKAGTRTRPPVLERRPQDDVQGAVVQWMVLRYYRDGVLRKELASEYGYSVRRVQEYLSGTKRPNSKAIWWLAYAAPMLRALERIGFPVRERNNQRLRADAQVAAGRAALRTVAHLVADDPRPEARRLVRDVALLTVEAPDA